MEYDPSYIPFSQRTGLKPAPPQLTLGEVSDELRRLLDYFIGLEVDRGTLRGFDASCFSDGWKRVALDFHVIILKQNAGNFSFDPYNLKKYLSRFAFVADIDSLFDVVEFFARHSRCSRELKSDLANAFVMSRTAYRIVDSKVIAIGTEEQAATFARAVADAEARDAGAARRHLIAAGAALRNSDWPGSVRESIHAGEAMALRLAPDTTTLGPALAALERKGHLHGGLKAAFSSLYGYASDEKGVRHARVFNEEAQVDEADALFMLGACASFVSYLLAKGD